MIIKNLQYARFSLISSVSCRAHHGWARRKNSQLQVLRWLENAVLILAFEVILIIFCTEFPESALDICSYTESTIGPTILGPSEKISK